jgi:hypothetical protein
MRGRLWQLLLTEGATPLRGQVQAPVIDVCHILKHKVPYKDLGCDCLDKTNAAHILKHCIKRLEALGLKVIKVQLISARKATKRERKQYEGEEM